MGSIPDMADQVQRLVDRVDDLEDELERERSRRKEAEARADRLEDRVDDLEDELESRAPIRWQGGNPADAELEAAGSSSQSFPLGGAITSKLSEADVEGKLGMQLEDLRDRLDSGELGGDQEAGAEPSGPAVKIQTPLEQVVDLPDDVASSELSANQERARFIASDVTSYASSVPAGYAINAGEVSRVLRAGMDVEGHSETVRRVMHILDELGGEDVEVVKRRGSKRVVFSNRLAKRLALVVDETHRVVRQEPA